MAVNVAGIKQAVIEDAKACGEILTDDERESRVALVCRVSLRLFEMERTVRAAAAGIMPPQSGSNEGARVLPGEFIGGTRRK